MFKDITLISVSSIITALLVTMLHRERYRFVKVCVVCKRRYTSRAYYCMHDASLLQYIPLELERIEEQGINQELLDRLPQLQAMSHANDGE